MKVVIEIKKTLFVLIYLVIILILLLHISNLRGHVQGTAKMVMGGDLYLHNMEKNENNQTYFNYESEDVEKYFRPSKLPVLNNRHINLDFIKDYYDYTPNEIVLPDNLFISPKDTIINYYSILREAANPVDNKNAGCGTLGNAKLPYPVAYQFLSSSFKETLSYEEYVKTFENILHINLLKLREVPVYENQTDNKRYFVEIETIQGSDTEVAYFAYYYGFMDITKENGNYRISNMNFYGENYLCAPYHGWNYDAESVVDIEYGEWCHLVKERYPVIQNDYVKYIPFKGMDGKEYIIVFFQLTNDTDIEIAQYRKDDRGEWELIQIDPTSCLNNKKSS